jgi:internalin A
MKKRELIGRILGIGLVFAVFVGLAGPAAPSGPVLADDPVVNFPDPNLEAVIRAYIGKPTGDIYESDLDGLTYLSAPGRGITNLSGLEHCTHLTVLSLGENQISDISPLSTLTSLTGLRLYSNQISDISPLSTLTSLTDLLSLDGNQISDISALSSLTSLIGLGLDTNQISDISGLSSLTSLTDLQLSRNQISDISALSSLTSLRNLGLARNQISDISALSSLTSLTKELHLEVNQISDVSPLSSLTRLTWLGLAQNQISDVSPLSSLTSLFALHLTRNQISDISPLSSPTSLRELFLGENQISDIGPLVNNSGLAYPAFVELSSNPLSADSISIYIPQLQARGVTVLYTPPSPTIRSVNPNSGIQGQTLSVTIIGTYLTGATSVGLGSGIAVNSFTVDSPTQIVANVSISSGASPGARDVSVTTPGGTAIKSASFTVTASPPPVQRYLAISSTTGGSVTTPGEGTFPYFLGTLVNLVASPDPGYKFVSWTGDVGTISDINAASTTITMNGDYKITANFVAAYDLTISTTTGGSVTTPGEGTFTYDAGSVVSMVANPTSGYHFVNWTGDVTTIGNVNAASTNITMNGNYEITANFEEIPPSPLYPTVATQTASNVTTNSATLNMNYTVGNFSPVQVRFAYRKSTDSSWSSTGWVSKVADGTYATSITGLDSSTQYDFKAQLKYDDTVIEGTTLQFTTTPPASTGWCFIATAAYGTPMAKEIQILREFRDKYLLTNPLGQGLVNMYYRISPPIAGFITEHPSLKPIVRAELMPVVAMCSMLLDIVPQFAGNEAW